MAQVLEGVAIEEPIYFDAASSFPPKRDYWHLTVPGDVAAGMGAEEAHRLGFTGRNVRVVMVDSGWFRHPYFTRRGYKANPVVLGPGTANADADESGHGTGESANVFAVAPDVDFTMVKANFVNSLGAFNAGVALNPQIITNSWGSSQQNGPLSAANQALAASVALAWSNGIVVVFSAGNGLKFGFPGQHPDVISVGGVFMDEDESLQASTFTAGFASNIFPGRNVPDVSGLVGQAPGASYIMLPVEPGDEIDTDRAGGNHPPGDETTQNDGWAAFSGTSAAAPQVAGVAALMKQVCPDLTPDQIRSIMMRSATDVTTGANAMGAQAGPGYDNATGHGLVDARRAVLRARLTCFLVNPINIGPPIQPVQPIIPPVLPPIQPPIVIGPQPIQPPIVIGPPIRPIDPLIRPPFAPVPLGQDQGPIRPPIGPVPPPPPISPIQPPIVVGPTIRPIRPIRPIGPIQPPIVVGPTIRPIRPIRPIGPVIQPPIVVGPTIRPIQPPIGPVPIRPIQPVVPIQPVGPIQPVLPIQPVGPIGPVIRPIQPIGPIGPIMPIGPVIRPIQPIATIDPGQQFQPQQQAASADLGSYIDAMLQAGYTTQDVDQWLAQLQQHQAQQATQQQAASADLGSYIDAMLQAGYTTQDVDQWLAQLQQHQAQQATQQQAASADLGSYIDAMLQAGYTTQDVDQWLAQLQQHQAQQATQQGLTPEEAAALEAAILAGEDFGF